MARHVLRVIIGITLLAAAVFAATMLHGSLPRHMLAHVLLVDVIAAATILTIPRAARSRFSARIDATVDARGMMSPVSWFVRSPLALLTAWTITLTLLMSPPGHRFATEGIGVVIEPILLLGIGLAFWRATFDQHARRPFTVALLHGGLAWWGRHAFAMIGRVVIVPAILMVWYVPVGSYAGADQRAQIEAASIVLGAEITIFGAAAMLFLILFVIDDSEQPAPAST
ncbi:MAG: hypothetical protein ABI200_07325 [Gaiellales bacterium]